MLIRGLFGRRKTPDRRSSIARCIASGAAVFFATPALACDVALVLAIDVSGSVDPAEYSLQSQGLSDALGDPVVSEALVKARAIVAVVQWSGKPHQALVVGWTATDTHEAVAALRSEIEAVPRQFRNYSTGIGEAVRISADLFKTAPRTCKRRIIDVSGDGPSNEGIAPDTMRGRLSAAGIIVNGLAIEGSEEGIAQYYQENIIHGPGAFVEVAKGFKDFPRAIRRKLLRELADRLALAKPTRPFPPYERTARGKLLSKAKQLRANGIGATR